MSKFLAIRWYSGVDNIGAVLVELEGGEKRVYVGAAQGINEEADMQRIKDWGARVEESVARAMFPEHFNEAE